MVPLMGRSCNEKSRLILLQLLALHNTNFCFVPAGAHVLPYYYSKSTWSAVVLQRFMLLALKIESPHHSCIFYMEVKTGWMILTVSMQSKNGVYVDLCSSVQTWIYQPAPMPYAIYRIPSPFHSNNPPNDVPSHLFLVSIRPPHIPMPYKAEWYH